MEGNQKQRNTFFVNNFDFVRLFAAFQVAFLHSFLNMEIEPSFHIKALFKIFSMFPGVPIFFFISGFLICRSYENNSTVGKYFRNRVLRIYPALVTCVSVSFLLIWISGYLSTVQASPAGLSALFLAKTTVLQFYNPEFMRQYGDGVLNGSLWTITVELQFYIMVPVMYRLLNLKRSGNKKLAALLLFFFFINRFYSYAAVEFAGTIPLKLLRVSFLPWFYMFLLGNLFQRNFELIHKYLSNKTLLLTALYIPVTLMADKVDLNMGNNINPVVYLVLIMLIFSVSYTKPRLSGKLLGGNDISYGVYIYHMPIINFMLYNGLKHQTGYAAIALLATLGTAALSWKYLEKPMLGFKKRPLRLG